VRLHDEPRLLFLYDVIGAMRKAGCRFAFWPSVCRVHHLPDPSLASSRFGPKRLGKDWAKREGTAGPQILLIRQRFLNAN
jgi:hypothetical protein